MFFPPWSRSYFLFFQMVYESVKVSAGNGHSNWVIWGEERWPGTAQHPRAGSSRESSLSPGWEGVNSTKSTERTAGKSAGQALGQDADGGGQQLPAGSYSLAIITLTSESLLSGTSCWSSKLPKPLGRPRTWEPFDEPTQASLNRTESRTEKRREGPQGQTEDASYFFVSITSPASLP